MTKEEMEKEVEFLEAKVKLTKDFNEKLDLRDRITKLKMEINGVKAPTDFDISCVGCGS